jgi:acyl carrier protein
MKIQEEDCMTFDKVAELLAERAGVEASEIKPEMTFKELNLDSLDTVDALMEIEDAFGVHLEITPDMQCVNDVVNQIREAGVTE